MTTAPLSTPWRGSVAIDGSLVAPEAATVSVFDRGFLYGDSVFDTTRTYGGKAFKLVEHVQRLERSAGKMGFALPWSVEQLVAEVEALLAEVRATAGDLDLVARLMVTRGQGTFGLDPADAQDPRRVLYINPLKIPTPETYRAGVEVISYPTYRPSDAALGAKVGNYLESVLAIRHARAKNAHEALILSHDGHVVEGTTTNVFAVHAGKLVTPPTTETLLPGITRALAIEAARSLGIDVEEQRMVPSDIATADEAFLTSSVREMLPIFAIDGFVIGNGESRPITRRVHEALRKLNRLPAPAPWE